MLDNYIVGSQIANLRRQKGLSQEELAEKLGISAQAISKWENGHTLPETALLPQMAGLLSCSIDTILMPFAVRDSAFQEFTRTICGKYGGLALEFYKRLKSKFNFTVSYDEKFNVFEAVFSGSSARFNVPGKEDFILRMDAEAGKANDSGNFAVRMPLAHCSGYMELINKMPEHVKRNFRVSDCRSCTCSCPYCMVYSFEGVEYKQCHFITLHLDSAENMEHILALVFAENEKYLISRMR